MGVGRIEGGIREVVRIIDRDRVYFVQLVANVK